VGHMEMTPIRKGMIHHGSDLDFEPTQKNLGCDFNFQCVGFNFRVFKVAKTTIKAGYAGD
jgi:hypothetical protein